MRAVILQYPGNISLKRLKTTSYNKLYHFRTQDLPIFVRMVDRDSIWGINNGLQSIITTTLMMNLVGYPFVLPDMIGGNGYNLNHEQADLPTKELFFRWVEANAFLPSMQFSFAPWNFDDEVSLADFRGLTVSVKGLAYVSREEL